MTSPQRFFDHLKTNDSKLSQVTFSVEDEDFRKNLRHNRGFRPSLVRSESSLVPYKQRSTLLHAASFSNKKENCLLLTSNRMSSFDGANVRNRFLSDITNGSLTMTKKQFRNGSYSSYGLRTTTPFSSSSLNNKTLFLKLDKPQKNALLILPPLPSSDYDSFNTSQQYSAVSNVTENNYNTAREDAATTTTEYYSISTTTLSPHPIDDRESEQLPLQRNISSSEIHNTIINNNNNNNNTSSPYNKTLRVKDLSKYDKKNFIITKSSRNISNEHDYEISNEEQQPHVLCLDNIQNYSTMNEKFLDNSKDNSLGRSILFSEDAPQVLDSLQKQSQSSHFSQCNNIRYPSRHYNNDQYNKIDEFNEHDMVLQPSSSHVISKNGSSVGTVLPHSQEFKHLGINTSSYPADDLPSSSLLYSNPVIKSSSALLLDDSPLFREKDDKVVSSTIHKKKKKKKKSSNKSEDKKKHPSNTLGGSLVDKLLTSKTFNTIFPCTDRNYSKQSSTAWDDDTYNPINHLPPFSSEAWSSTLEDIKNCFFFSDEQTQDECCVEKQQSYRQMRHCMKSAQMLFSHFFTHQFFDSKTPPMQYSTSFSEGNPNFLPFIISPYGLLTCFRADMTTELLWIKEFPNNDDDDDNDYLDVILADDFELTFYGLADNRYYKIITGNNNNELMFYRTLLWATKKNSVSGTTTPMIEDEFSSINNDTSPISTLSKTATYFYDRLLSKKNVKKGYDQNQISLRDLDDTDWLPWDKIKSLSFLPMLDLVLEFEGQHWFPLSFFVSAKRKHYLERSVITSTSNIDVIKKMGIPEQLQEKLLYFETVTRDENCLIENNKAGMVLETYHNDDNSNDDDNNRNPVPPQIHITTTNIEPIPSNSYDIIEIKEHQYTTTTHEKGNNNNNLILKDVISKDKYDEKQQYYYNNESSYIEQQPTPRKEEIKGLIPALKFKNVLLHLQCPNIVEIVLGHSFIGQYPGEPGWDQRILCNHIPSTLRIEVLKRYSLLRKASGQSLGQCDVFFDDVVPADLGLPELTDTLLPWDIPKLCTTWAAEQDMERSPCSYLLGFRLGLVQIQHMAYSNLNDSTMMMIPGGSSSSSSTTSSMEYLSPKVARTLRPEIAIPFLLRVCKYCNVEHVIQHLEGLRQWIKEQECYTFHKTSIIIYWDTASNLLEKEECRPKAHVKWTNFGYTTPFIEDRELRTRSSVSSTTTTTESLIEEKMTTHNLIDKDTNTTTNNKTPCVVNERCNNNNDSVIKGLSNLISILLTSNRIDSS